MCQLRDAPMSKMVSLLKFFKVKFSEKGIFVQWIMSLGSLLVGFGVNIVMDNPPMNLIAAAGGILWTFGKNWTKNSSFCLQQTQLHNS